MDFSDLGGQPVKGGVDFSDLGGQAVTPETGLFGQTIEKETGSPHGWDILKGEPYALASEEETRNDPGLRDATVSDALNVAGAAGLGKLSVGLAGKATGSLLNAIPATENIVPTVGRIATNQTLKSLGGSMGQIKAMSEGREGQLALDKAAEYARNNGLVDVLSTNIGRENQLNSLLKSSGKKIGDLRSEAGTAQPGVLEKIEEYLLSKKYGPKALRSKEAPAVKKTIESVREMSGETAAKAAPELPVIKPGATTGEPHALFSYNSDMNPEGKMKSMYTLFGDANHPLLKQGKGLPGAGNTTQTLDWFKERGIPIVGREPRTVGKWEPLDLGEPGTPATHAGYANAATEINDFSAGNKIYQPVNAETDVANALSRENNAGIVQTLGSDKGKQYLDALEDQSRLHPLEHLQKRGELREVAGRGGFGGIPQKIADAFGHRASAKGFGSLHDFLRGKQSLTGPALKRHAPIAAVNDFLTDKYGK